MPAFEYASIAVGLGAGAASIAYTMGIGAEAIHKKP